MENIEQRVKKIVAEQLGVNEGDIKNESAFVEDLGADSLDTVELVMALEDEFECEIPDEEAEKIRTVQQAIDYVNAHQEGCRRAPGSSRATILSIRRRVVVTGLGVISPVGNDVATAWTDLRRRPFRHRRASRSSTPRSSVRRSPARSRNSTSNRDPAKEARHMDTFIHYGMAASAEAFRDIGT